MQSRRVGKQTPVDVAAAAGHLEIVKFLLDAKTISDEISQDRIRRSAARFAAAAGE